MKASLLAFACGVALAAAAAPVAAQHAGHHPPDHGGHAGHAAPAAKKKPVAKKAVAKKSVTTKLVAKKSVAKKAVAKKPAGKAIGAAASKPVARKAPLKATPSTTPARTDMHAHHGGDAAVDHAAMGHAPATTNASASDNATVDHSQHGAAAADHAAMGHAPATTNASASDHATVDHSQHGAAAVDHAAMGHGAPPSRPDPHADHAAMGHALPDLPADAAPRTPIPALTAADRAAAFPPVSGHAAHDRGIHSYWLADRLEWQDTDDDALAWEGVAWIGGDVDRVWLRSEGEAAEGVVEHANVEVLYGHATSAWWDVVAGLRHDFGEGPSRTWAAVGVQGLAPYKFEVQATAYVGDGGRTAASLEAEYDTLISNRLILQWTGEAMLHGRDDPSRGIGSGLSTVEAGARLRYEVTRRFAPYVGLQWERAFGRTAGLRRDDGHAVDDTRLVAGIRFWF